LPPGVRTSTQECPNHVIVVPPFIGSRTSEGILSPAWQIRRRLPQCRRSFPEARAWRGDAIANHAGRGSTQQPRRDLRGADARALSHGHQPLPPVPHGRLQAERSTG